MVRVPFHKKYLLVVQENHNMNYQQPIHWHSGLFLQPQHFQLSDLYHQYWRQRQIDLTLPYGWGVVRFELDNNALQNGHLTATQAVFVFPDGTFVDTQINAILPARTLHQVWRVSDNPLRVYVGVRHFNPEQANVADSDDGVFPEAKAQRWSVADKLHVCRDIYGDGPDAEISTLKYELRFFLHEELNELSGFDLLPLLHLNCSEGQFIIDNQFVPPCLSISATGAIKHWVTKVSGLAISKIRRLETLQSQGSAELHCTKDEFKNMMEVLGILCRNVAQLEYFKQSPHVHPWYYIGILRQLNIELLSLCNDTSAGEASKLLAALNAKYEHTMLGQILHELYHQFSSLMNRMLSISNSRYLMKKNENNFYVTTLDAKDFSGCEVFYLCLCSSLLSGSDEYYFNSQNIKLLPLDKVKEVLSYSLGGIPLTFISCLPYNLSVRDDACCFRIDHHHLFWKNAITDKKITLYWSNAPEDLRAEIIWAGGER